MANVSGRPSKVECAMGESQAAWHSEDEQDR
jgi:hypothetical protein